MPLYVKDKTRRFPERPHYQPDEIDRECEQIMSSYLTKIYGAASFPVDTEDLKNLIETEAEELDCYADLSNYGEDVEGVTEFRLNKLPIVRISARLTEDSRYENRLRTTLTHEYGHVRFHGYLFQLNATQEDLFQTAGSQLLVSKRDNILNAPQTDWMEWQAGYASGAFLMPASKIRSVVRSLNGGGAAEGALGNAEQQKLVQRISDEFKVSKDAARIRLIQLKIVNFASGPSLFA